MPAKSVKRQGILLGTSGETLVVTRVGTGEWQHPVGYLLEDGAIHKMPGGHCYELQQCDGRWRATYRKSTVPIPLYAENDMLSEVDDTIYCTLEETGAFRFGVSKIASGDEYLHHNDIEYVLSLCNGIPYGYRKG